MTFQLFWSHISVFHHIVEETGGNHTGAGADVAQQISHRHGMHDVRVTAGAELPLMELESEIKGCRQQGFRIGWAAMTDSRGDVIDAFPQPVRQLDAVVLG